MTIPSLPLSRWRVSVLALTVLVAVASSALDVATAVPAVVVSPAPTRTAVQGDDAGFSVTAAMLVVDGLRIDGVGPAPSSTTSKPTLRLNADQAIGEDLAIGADVAHETLRVSCPAWCRLAGRPVRLYVIELTATPVVAGVPLFPITLGASTPAPDVLGVLQLPQLTLRDVRGRFVLISAADVETDRSRVELRER